MTIAHHLPDETLDRAFDELADFECVFDVAEFHLYVHDERAGLAADPGLRAPADAGGELIALRQGAVHRSGSPTSRERRPFVDHAVRMQEHYGGVKAGQQAGAVTYFAFLSVFPILAIAFFVVG